MIKVDVVRVLNEIVKRRRARDMVRESSSMTDARVEEVLLATLRRQRLEMRDDEFRRKYLEYIKEHRT